MRSAHDNQACIRSALRRRRRALGLTQQQAAQLLGMSRLTYHRIETGARHIHFADLAAICELFNCHPVELLQDSQLASAYANAATALLGEMRHNLLRRRKRSGPSRCEAGGSNPSSSSRRRLSGS